MAKRMFETLDQMNQNDSANNTETVGIYNQMVEVKKAKGGGHLTMGVEEKTVMDFFAEKDKVAILLIIDKAEFDKISKA